jgi:hypothetical protein
VYNINITEMNIKSNERSGTMKKYNLSAICKTANALRKQGYTLGKAFTIAWVIAKQKDIKVRGTSYENRQTALEHLMKYQPDEIKFTLIAEPENPYDKNAVAVMTSVKGSKDYKIGYIPSITAPVVSAILNKGVSIKTTLKSIIGGYAEYANLGLIINISF